jgi:hypothetical protein
LNTGGPQGQGFDSSVFLCNLRRFGVGVRVVKATQLWRII